MPTLDTGHHSGQQTCYSYPLGQSFTRLRVLWVSERILAKILQVYPAIRYSILTRGTNYMTEEESKRKTFPIIVAGTEFLSQ